MPMPLPNAGFDLREERLDKLIIVNGVNARFANRHVRAGPCLSMSPTTMRSNHTRESDRRLRCSAFLLMTQGHLFSRWLPGRSFAILPCPMTPVDPAALPFPYRALSGCCLSLQSLGRAHLFFIRLSRAMGHWLGAGRHPPLRHLIRSSRLVAESLICHN